MSSKPKGQAKPKPTAKSVGATGRGSGGAAGRGIAGPTGRGGAAGRGRGTTGGSVGRGRGESIPTGEAAVRGRGSSVPTRGATVRGRGSSVSAGRAETLPTPGGTTNRVRTRGGLGAGARGKGKEHAVDASTSAGVGEADRGVEPSTFPLPARSMVAPSGNPNQTPSGNPSQTSPGGVTARSFNSSNPCSENTTSINRTRIPAQYPSSSQQRPRLQLGIETATSLPPPQNIVDNMMTNIKKTTTTTSSFLTSSFMKKNKKSINKIQRAKTSKLSSMPFSIFQAESSSCGCLSIQAQTTSPYGNVFNSK